MNNQECWKQLVDAVEFDIEDDQWHLIGNAASNANSATNGDIAQIISKTTRRPYAPLKNKMQVGSNKWMMRTADDKVYGIITSPGKISVYEMLMDTLRRKELGLKDAESLKAVNNRHIYRLNAKDAKKVASYNRNSDSNLIKKYQVIFKDAGYEVLAESNLEALEKVKAFKQNEDI